MTYTGSVNYYLFPSPIPVAKAGLFDKQQKLINGAISNPYYTIEGIFTAKGLFDMCRGRRTWHSVAHIYKTADEIRSKFEKLASENQHDDSVKESYLNNLQYTSEFAKFWSKGINVDPYEGFRVWEEGVFINGRLEGQGKYCFLDPNGN